MLNPDLADEVAEERLWNGGDEDRADVTVREDGGTIAKEILVLREMSVYPEAKAEHMLRFQREHTNGE